MKFYYKGNKKNNETSVAEGCLMVIGFAAFVFFLSLLDDIEDIKDYIFEIFFFILMAGSVLFMVFAKKGKLSNYNITLKNNYLSIEKVNVSLDDILIDIYENQTQFKRYHLRDKAGKIAVFSVFEDDLLKYFRENFPKQIHIIQQTSQKHEGAFISVLAKEQNLFYDLSRGKYTIKKDNQPEISIVPEVYTYDPKYKLGKPLIKSKT